MVRRERKKEAKLGLPKWETARRPVKRDFPFTFWK
jgi:hypothetical protein